MPRRPRNVYLPLDVEFFDNDRVLRAGERASWLYLSMCCRAKRMQSDGILSPHQIERLGVPAWRARLKTLVDVGLVFPTDDDRFVIVGWLERNLSAAQIESLRAADRARKGSSFQSDSSRNPSGVQQDPREVEVEEKRREVEVVPTTEGALARAALKAVRR